MKNVFIGIDVSKRKLDATIISKKDETSEIIGYDVFGNDKDGIRKLMSWVKKTARATKEECLYCAETTGSYDRLLCDIVFSKGYDMWRESALEIKRCSGLRRGKDDKADSKAIADYAMRYADRMKPYRPMSKVLAELRDLYLYRDSLVEERKGKLTRAREIKANSSGSKSLSFMYKTSMEDAERIGKRINECNRRIRSLIASNEELEKNYGHITSIKGVSLVNGVAMLVYTENFSKFSTPNKMATYYGVAPFRNRSGSSIDSRADVSCYCNRKLNGLLAQAAMSAIRTNGDIRAYYERLVKAGKPKGVAINNVKNKLIHITFSLVRHDCDYEEGHEWKRALQAGNAAIRKETSRLIN